MKNPFHLQDFRDMYHDRARVSPDMLKSLKESFTYKEIRLCTMPKLITGIGFGGDPIRARVTV